MVNESVSFYTDPFNFLDCFKETHVGFVWAFITLTLCFLLGTPAHFWNFWLLLRVGFKIKPAQVFPLMLTAVELLFCINLSIEILNVVVFKSNTCLYVSTITFSMFWTCRLLIQMCICIEQYLAVLYPVAFLRYKAIHHRIVLAAPIWVMTSGYGFCLSFRLFEFPDVFFMFTSVTVMIVILFCYVSVLRALRRSGLQGREVTGNKDVRNQQKRTAFNSISFLLLIIVLSYLPLVIIGIFSLMKTEMILFQCDVVPGMLSINIYSIMIPPLLKLYKGNLKCLNNGKENHRR